MSERQQEFIAQAKSLPELVSAQSPLFADATRRTLSFEEVFALREVIFAGSGDSLIAGMAAAQLLRDLTGLPVSAMPSMQAARYVERGFAPSGRARSTLLVPISSSGEAARLVEATRRLRAAGALTVALTANAESRLGQSAERIIDIAIPAGPGGPGLRSYVGSMLGAMHLAIRIAEMRMALTMDRAEALRAEMTALAPVIEGAVTAVSGASAGFDWPSALGADCLGSGPAFTSASFAAAKLIEAAGVHAVPQDAEEFHHLNFFIGAPERVPALLFAVGKGASLSRNVELLEALGQLGRPTLVLADDDRLDAGLPMLRLPPCREVFAPLVHAGPAAIIAAGASDALDAPHYRAHSGPWRGAQGAGFVRNSQILTAEE